ncbi:ArnT family glycosyltransferase [Blastococcus sp. SYSU DS0617]
MSTVLDRPVVRTPHRADLPAGEPARRRLPVTVERLMVGLGLVAIGVAHSVNLAGWPRYWDDEGTYYSQAWAVSNLGSLAPYTYWYDHPPAGWLQMAVVRWLPEMLLGGNANSSLLAGRIMMVGYTLVAALLVYLLARRVGLARGWAMSAMLLWGLNPLVVYEGRQVLLDNVALPWLLGAFLLALSRQRHLGHYMAAGLCFGVAVLSKETLLIFLPALLVALWQNAYRPTRPFAVMGFSVVVAAAGGVYLLYALIRSELFPGPDHVSVWDAMAFQLGGRDGSGWIFDSEGPVDGANDSFTGWLALDSGVLIIGGVAAALVALAVRRLRPIAVGVLVAAAVALRPDGYLPQMYVVAVLPLCALLVVGLLDAVWRQLMRARAVPVRLAAGTAMLAVLAVAAAQFADWRYTYAVAWTDDANDVATSAVDFAAEDLPQDSTIVVGNALWNDFVEAGWDAEDVVWFYKVDSDGAVTEQLGGDYLGIDYLMWSEDVAKNAGPIVVEAYEHSELVWAEGSGEDRVEVRRVRSLAEQADIQAAEDARVAAELAAERRALDVFMTEPSVQFPGLTNGQVEGIRADRGTMTVDDLADKYDATPETIDAVLASGGR